MIYIPYWWSWWTFPIRIFHSNLFWTWNNSRNNWWLCLINQRESETSPPDHWKYSLHPTFSRGHTDNLWCFFYQHTIWLIYRLVNRRLGTSPIVAWYKHKKISYPTPFAELVICGCNIYIISYKLGKKALYQCTNIDPRTCTPVIEPSLLTTSADGLFLGCYYSTKLIIYFDPKTQHTKRTFHFYIDEYDVKLHPEESMSLGTLMLQEYPSGVYHPVTTSYEPNIILIQPTLELSNTHVSSSEILATYLLLPTSGTPTNITILNYPISSIPYISQIPSIFSIYNNFPMDTRCNIYVVAIDN